jgi:ATP-dependent helicase/nuclease subunit A
MPRDKRNTDHEQLPDPAPRPESPVAPQPPDASERRAILEQLDTTMLVEASAGSGKTSSMVGRMVALLAEGKCTVDSLAAITFTRKAAAELRSRFHAALERSARQSQGTVRERLAVAAEHAQRCYIGTIHSFCARLLRERPVEAGVDLSFEELEETVDQRLRREAWAQYVSGRIAAGDPLLGELDDLGLQVADLAEAFLSFADFPDVARWPAAEVEMPDLAPARSALESYASDLRQLLPELPDDPGNDTLMPKCRRLVRMVRQADLSRPAELLEILAEFGNVKVVQKNWPGGKKQALAEQERWQTFTADVAQPLVQRWRERRYPVALRVLQGAMVEYERGRREAGGLNYQDLLLRAAALLRDKPAVRRYFRRRFSHLLVDEFQDTDPIQAEVMLLAAADDPDQTDWRACRPVPGSLFVVGDPKQSIYRFRRADMVTYNEVKRIIQAHGQVLTLWSNFRSTRPVVEWVNQAFDSQFPTEANAYAPQRFPMESAHGSDDDASAVLALDVADAGARNSDMVDREADQIAAIVDAAIQASTPDKPSRPGDFLIVCMRKRNLGVYARKLSERGIPCQVTGGTVLNEVPEIGWLATLVAALVEPDNPVTLVAALRSPLFGVSDVELYRYRRAGGRFTLLGGDGPRPADAESPLDDALDRLRRYGRWLRRLPPLAALERMAADLGLGAAAASRAGGNVAAGSLARAMELLRAAQGQMHGIDQLAEFLRQLANGSEPRDGVPALPAAQPPLRIMNLHQAKGLEAPVVFLADPTGWGDHGVLLHVDRRGSESCGYLALYGPAQGWQAGPLLACPAGWEDLAAEETRFTTAERDRQFYVAATRAGRQLIITRPEKSARANAWEYFRETLAAQPAAQVPAIPRPAAHVEPAEAPTDASQASLASTADRWQHALTPTYAVAAAKQIALTAAHMLAATGEHGAEWGSVIHCLLEAAMREPNAELRRLALARLENEGLDPALAERAVAMAQRVTRSEIWRRAQQSSRCLVEVPFHIFRPQGCASSTVPTLVRGVIDLAFREPAGWVIVDYKTDAHPAGSLDSLVAHYRPQLEAYAAAWQEMLAEPIAELGLYFTHPDRYVPL